MYLLPSSLKRKYCSNKCTHSHDEFLRNAMKNFTFKGKKHSQKTVESMKGSGNHQWKGGVTPISKLIRESSRYRNWRKTVFERDRYTCIECGDNEGRNLNAHHLKSFSSYPELRFDLDNGVTLCIPCHIKTDTFGKKLKERVCK